MTETDIITGYHAHVYYSNPEHRAQAAVIREQADSLFEVALGRWRDEPVGPHPTAMFQMSFATDQFSKIIPWLMLNRGGLSILVHPETGDHVPDHRDFPLWLGEKLALDISYLDSGNTSA